MEQSELTISNKNEPEPRKLSKEEIEIDRKKHKELEEKANLFVESNQNEIETPMPH